MPIAKANGVGLHFQLGGSGEALVLVHGSWVDHTVFAALAALLEPNFEVLRFDRRGHSRSARPQGPGTIGEDADDLAALLRELELAPAHVVGVSWGGSVALWLAIRHPEVVRSIAVHEPPLFALLEDSRAAIKPLRSQRAVLAAVEADLESGRWETAARRYVEQVAYEPGAWRRLSADARRRFIKNAPTYLDQCRDPDQLRVDLDALGKFGGPVMITEGDRRTALFGPITERLCEALPQARRVLLPGAAHDPHLSDPDGFAAALAGFASLRLGGEWVELRHPA